MITVIKLKRAGNTLYIDNTKEAYNTYNGNIQQVAHNITISDLSSGTYCLFFDNLSDIDRGYRNSKSNDTMSFAEYIYRNANIKVQK